MAVLPKSKPGDTIYYTRSPWEQLTRYLKDGSLSIDNNLVENIIRPVALGRKSWLFAGSADGAYRMAILYSPIATCKLNGIVAYECFVPAGTDISEIGTRDHRRDTDFRNSPMQMGLVTASVSGTGLATLVYC